MKQWAFLFLFTILFLAFAINVSGTNTTEIKLTKFYDFLMPVSLKDDLEKNKNSEKHQKENKKHTPKNGISNQIKYKRRIGFIPQTEYES